MLPIVPLLIHESVRYGFAMFFARKVCLSVSSERKKSVCVGVFKYDFTGRIFCTFVSMVHFDLAFLCVWRRGGEGDGDEKIEGELTSMALLYILCCG